MSDIWYLFWLDSEYLIDYVLDVTEPIPSVISPLFIMIKPWDNQALSTKYIYNIHAFFIEMVKVYWGTSPTSKNIGII